MEPKRLNKFISDTGFCSRREADKLIEEERVTVNGRSPEPGMRVTPKDKVRIDDQLLTVRDEAPVYLLLNKPSGLSATSDMSVRDNVIRAINHPASLEPVGRLDRDDEGVLLLSNDSDFVRKLTKADNRLEKELIVTVNKPLSSEFIAKLSEACTTFEDGNPKKANISKEGTTRFRIVLEPGMDHHIRRLCEAMGYQVTFVQRVRIQDLTLTKLQKGHWRTLTGQEVERLKNAGSSRAPRSTQPFIGDSRYSSERSKTATERSRPGSERGGARPAAKSSSYSKPAKPGAGPREGKSRVVTKDTPKAGSRGAGRSSGSSVGRNNGPKTSNRKGPSSPNRGR